MTTLQVDRPLSGYYLARSPHVPRARLHKDQLWVPARIWWTVPADPAEFGELDMPPLKAFCEVDGREVDAYAAWPYLAGNPITKEEYERRTLELEQLRSNAAEPTLFEDEDDEMNVNEAYPSKYLSAHDLQGKDVTVTIREVVMETLGNDNKPVCYFVNSKKGLVVNKTNMMCIAALYGPETDDWTGQKITLFSAWVDFKGEQKQAIRLRGPGVNMAPKRTAPAPRQPAPPHDEAPFDDSVPF